VKWVVRELCSDPESCADRYLACEDLFAVADGMGEGEAPATAAQKAVEMLSSFRPIKNEEEMREAFKKVNEGLVKLMGSFGDEEVSGTTLSALSVSDGSFVVGHVGDSRIYLFRDGKGRRLTEDQVKVKGGKKVVSVLGLQWNPAVYTASGELKEGDTFLLISDGFTRLLSEEVLMSLIRPGYLEESAKRLEEALRGLPEGEDLTFILLQV